MNEISWQVQIICIAVAGPVIASVIVACKEWRSRRSKTDRKKGSNKGVNYV